MTTEELQEWNSIQSDDEAKLFIDRYWARRDPTPGTEANEFRWEIQSRINYANNHIHVFRKQGSTTDQGKAYVLFGPPDEIHRSSQRRQASNVSPFRPGRWVDPNASILDAPVLADRLGGPVASDPGTIRVVTWRYAGAKAKRMGDPTGAGITLTFADLRDKGEFKLSSLSEFEAARTAVIAASVGTTTPLPDKTDRSASPATNEVALRIIVVEDKDTAAKLFDGLRNGADFAALAKTNSTHASAPLGGYIGRIPKSELARDLALRVENTAPGEVFILERGPHEYALVKILSEREAAEADAVAGLR